MWPNSLPRLHALGWIEYILPDASCYYVHPTRRVATDIDLRDTKKLQAVGDYLDHTDVAVPVGMEVWLKDASSVKRGLAPVMVWIDHRKRVVSLEPLSMDGGDTGTTSGIPTGEDRECERSAPGDMC
jgi:hypothetical protein